MFGANLPPGLMKDIMARMIAYRIQEEAFGGLDRETLKLLDRLARGEKPNELNRCPFRKSYPDVVVMQAGQDRDGNDGTGPLDRPT
jgi:Protein of unknown function (DUF2924)